MEEVCRSSPTA